MTMPKQDTEQKVGMDRCANLPNDAPEGHYWAWHHNPQCVPTEYRQCMTCGRIDASEAIDKSVNEARKNNKSVDAVKYMIGVWDEVLPRNWRETPDHVQNKFLEAEAHLNKKGEE